MRERGIISCGCGKDRLVLSVACCVSLCKEKKRKTTTTAERPERKDRYFFDPKQPSCPAPSIAALLGPIRCVCVILFSHFVFNTLKGIFMLYIGFLSSFSCRAYGKGNWSKRPVFPVFLSFRLFLLALHAQHLASNCNFSQL